MELVPRQAGHESQAVDGNDQAHGRHAEAGQARQQHAEQQVGGNDEEIIVVSRESGSGTRGAFEEILKIEKEVEGKKISGLVQTALQAEGTGAVKANVASKANAIGYVSLGYIDETIKTVQVEGADATAENITAGTYPVARPFVLVTKGEISETDQAFLDFVMSSEGQAEAEKDGYIRVS